MADEKKIEVMEGELKLLKAEVKESLVNVRDFLTTMKLPLPVRDLDGIMENQMSIQGGLTLDSGEGVPKPPSGAGRQPPQESAAPARKPAAPQPGLSMPVQVPEAPAESPKMPEKVVPHMHLEKPKDEVREDDGEDKKEDKMREEDKMGKESVQTSPQVNLLANLIRWVSVARNEIGNEKLRTFLEVYAIGSDLSPELKEIILHLADVIVAPSGDGSTADVWSRLLLELHGILSGGGTSLLPLSPPGEEEAKDKANSEDKAEAMPVPDRSHKPVRLKLVVPDGENGEKEFDVEEFSVNME